MISEEKLRIPAFLRRKEIARYRGAPKVTWPFPDTITKTTPTPRMTSMVMAIEKPIRRKITPTPKLEGEDPYPRIQMAQSPIGIVTHFYEKISVAVLKLTGPLQVGDRIQLVGKKGPFVQKITSMQIDRQDVEKANKGDDIGIKVKKPVVINEIASITHTS